MAIIPPELPPRRSEPKTQTQTEDHPPATKPTKQSSNSLTTPLLATAAVIALVSTLSWARRWLLSGCAIESLIIIIGAHNKSRVLPVIPLWTVLATINLVYAISATSWLLYGVFAALCWLSIPLTCLFQFAFAADYTRRGLRKMLRQLHFTRDKIALFNLPALEIDVDVKGLMAIRGITISLSSLTVVAHGIELGLKLADDIEMACHVDHVTIPLFRRLDVGDIYANIKGGTEMTFGELGEDDATSIDDDNIFDVNTGLLRAATAGSEGFKERPKLRESLTGVSYIKDSSIGDGFGSLTMLSPDDAEAEKQYYKMLDEIRTGSAVYQSRQQIRKRSKEMLGHDTSDPKDMRAAISAELHQVPSITHPPDRSIRVTTLQNLSPPAVRTFLHRLPFLLRLLLMIITHFHPVTFHSINAAGSGKWMTSLLQQKVFKHYAANNAELRRLIRRVSAWLADANFCFELTGIEGVAQVPISYDYDITAILRLSDIMAYRVVPETHSIVQVIRLGGADATFTIPSYLLPHHEHIIPEKPTKADEEDQAVKVELADGLAKTVQAEQVLDRMQKDVANMKLSAHASLPAVFDQSMLNFVAALVKATKIIELEKHIDEVDQDEDVVSPTAPTSPEDSVIDDDGSIKSVGREGTKGFRALTSNIRQNLNDTTRNLKDGSTREAIKEFAKDMHNATRDTMKKAVVGGMVNDRWIAKMVGKVAAKLEQAQGDVGYSGDIPIALEPYRLLGEKPSKLLP